MLISPFTKLVALMSTLLAVASTLLAVAASAQPAHTSPPVAITRLTRDPGNALRPTWSPDNRRIAFESNRDGAFHLYVMNADGSDQRPLTSGSDDDRHPAWSS